MHLAAVAHCPFIACISAIIQIIQWYLPCLVRLLLGWFLLLHFL